MIMYFTLKLICNNCFNKYYLINPVKYNKINKDPKIIL